MGLQLLGLIEDYRQGLLPLIVPLTLLKHHSGRYPVPDRVPVPSAAWVHEQVYLQPYPKELMLRNRVQAHPLWMAEAGENLLLHDPAPLELWHTGSKNRGLAQGAKP